MEQDIVNFLPKYPNIKQFEEEIFNTYDEDFDQAIYGKKEFYDDRLTATEEFPNKAGVLMKHQKLIARFFSSYTIYDELLLVHEMGTGKTCSAVGAIEQIKSEGGGFRGALYLAKGDALINNFINELIFKCTDGRYIPENYEKLSELEKVHRKKKAIRDYYSLNTFETFAKEIRKINDEEIRKRYNNKIIIVDEVHNLRIQSKEKGLNIYNQFLRFLHVVQDCKILLMSGTPMKDNVDEIASVMNLILPFKNGIGYIPTGEDFLNEYFTGSDDMYKIKSNKVKELKELFRGRVSYLKAMQSDIKKVFAGKHSGNLTHIKVVDDYMSEFQSKIYDEAYKLDRTERKGVYSKSRQASLLVFPDGSYGEAGYNKYIRKLSKARTIIEDDGKKKTMYNYIMEPELRKAIMDGTDNNHEKMLKNLEKYSSKYSASIRNILQAQKEGKSVFIYNEFVQGSGLILFGSILELFGFSKASGSEPKGSENLRYASLTNLTATTKQVRQLVDRFNQPDNMYGKIIGVIMGSRKIAEGFSLQNVQVEEIQTPWFNYSETAQAIARGYRLGSHRMLLASGKKPELMIYQRVSIPSGEQPSIDLEMYEISEIKDISIKGVERIIKESAWDCALTYERNHIVGYDGERECDYMKCDYNCDGVPSKIIGIDIANSKLDHSTYQLYYAQSSIREIIDQLVLLFRDNFRLDLASLIDYFPNYSSFELISALRTMIIESIQVINKYGFPSYVKEENNIFFLVDSLSVSGKFSSDYYTEYPHIKKPTTFVKVVKPLYYNSLPKIIKESCNANTQEDIRKTMTRLPLDIQEFYLESSILARKKGIEQNSNIRDLVLEYFKNYFIDIDGVWVSWLLYDEQEIMRCLIGDVWSDCDEKYIEKIDKRRKNIQVDMEKNSYGYYGQYNPESNEFCIRDLTTKTALDEKGHKRTSGKRCTNWDGHELILLAIKLNLPIPSKENMDVKEWKKWEKNKNNLDKLLKELTTKNRKEKVFAGMKDLGIQEVKTMPEEEKRRVLFWITQAKKPICSQLEEWFRANNLLVEDRGCGKGDKKKI